MTDETTEPALKVIDVSGRIAPHMSDAARAALVSKHHELDEHVVTVSRMWDHDPDDVDFRHLGHDLSAMVEQVTAVGKMVVDGCLSVPMLIPLRESRLASDLTVVPGPARWVVVLYARVVGSEKPDKLARLRELALLSELHVVDLGTLPPATCAKR